MKNQDGLNRDEFRTEYITFRCKKWEKEVIAAAAKRSLKNVTDFQRDAIIAESKAVLGDRVFRKYAQRILE